MSKYQLEERIEILSELIHYGIATKKDIKEHSKLLDELKWLEYQEEYNSY